MNLEKLYKMQDELDKYIIKNRNIVMSDEELLDNTILALLVEVGELANTTRCFKHWSTKGIMEKDIVLEELADVLHFYLSIGNQLGEKWMLLDYEKKSLGLIKDFKRLYFWASRKIDYMAYHEIGDVIYNISKHLGFTDEEVEQAYLKKHDENYRRQEEGY